MTALATRWRPGCFVARRIIAQSAIYNIVGAIKKRGLEQRDIVLVVAEHSENVRKLIRELLPSIRMIEQNDQRYLRCGGWLFSSG